MDSSQPGGAYSNLDSLRTVEFRQTLRGYHIDDVDEYLERVAVEAEALQEQLRQAGERLKQAAERIAHLERQVAEGGRDTPAVGDDTLQRTLLLAQKFVDQTKAEAESQARTLVREAEERARALLGEAEERARKLTEDTERQLREEINRLEGIRNQLLSDVDSLARHLDDERSRLRGALGELLAWVDERIQPAATLLGQRAAAVPGAEEHPGNAGTAPTGRDPGAQALGGEPQPHGAQPTAGARPAGAFDSARGDAGRGSGPAGAGARRDATLLREPQGAGNGILR